MKRPVRIAAGLVATAVLLAGVAMLQARVDQAREADPASAELLYLPNERLLTHFTAGLNNVLADVIWLSALQYTAGEIAGRGNFDWLQHMLDTATRLDPYFVDVYRYGAVFLAALRADDNAALELLARGYVQNPHAWELPYEMGMIYLLNRQHEPDSEKLAAYYLSVSTSTGRAPERVFRLADELRNKTGLDAYEADLWARMAREAAERGDTITRDIALRKAALYRIRQNVKQLNEFVEAFVQRQGRAPESMQEFCAVLTVNPCPGEDELGGRYFLGGDGTVYNTTVLDEEVQRRQRILENALRSFHREHGRYPEQLELLLSEGGLLKWQPHPYPDGEWDYDPATGTLSG